MRLSKIILFIIVLPVTLFLDYLLFASGTKCQNCGHLSIWLTSPESFSFPAVTLLYTISNEVVKRFKSK